MRFILFIFLPLILVFASCKDKTSNNFTYKLLREREAMQKMLIAEAVNENLTITDTEVDAQLKNRIQYFIMMYGSKEKLKKISGKNIDQIREENREAIKEQMLVERAQNKILENVKVTPAEIEAFFKKIPSDSLPYFPETVVAGQIVIAPQISANIVDFQTSLTRLDSIRDLLVSGKMSFEEGVKKFSTDESTKDSGGLIVDPYINTTELKLSKLTWDTQTLLDSLKTGQISSAHIFETDANTKSCRILYLKDRKLGHTANLKDDYTEIEEAVLNQKKQERMQEWVNFQLGK